MSVLPAKDAEAEEPVGITAAQKMLSATSGSLLTGLLGMRFDVPLPGSAFAVLQCASRS